jgi:hypothetical protein
MAILQGQLPAQGEHGVNLRASDSGHRHHAAVALGFLAVVHLLSRWLQEVNLLFRLL